MLPSLINPIKFKNTSDFIEYSYSVFIKNFNPNSPIIKFNGKYVTARPKILDCSNCGNKCNNLFKCENCPFANKEDIFQHICSDEDSELTVLPGFKNHRTPGIFNRTRTSKVVWLKFMIENYKNDKLIRYYNSHSAGSNRELNHYFWLYNYQYILILVEEKNSSRIYIRSCYDIKSDSDEKKHYKQYRKFLEKLEKECT